jgi:hypothetical protein
MKEEIKQLQEKAREEFRKTMTDNRSWSWEDVLKNQDTLIEQSYKQGRKDVVKELKAKLVKEKIPFKMSENHEKYEEYNRAIDCAIRIINNLTNNI